MFEPLILMSVQERIRGETCRMMGRYWFSTVEMA
jgi:hypothetical protein